MDNPLTSLQSVEAEQCWYRAPYHDSVPDRLSRTSLWVSASCWSMDICLPGRWYLQSSRSVPRPPITPARPHFAWMDVSKQTDTSEDE